MIPAALLQVRPVTWTVLLLCLFSLPLHAAASEGAPVTVVAAQKKLIQRQVNMTGTVTSPQVAQLSPSISGLITKLHADEGQRVEAGALLLTLDDELAQLNWQGAEATVNERIAALDDARRRLAEAQRLEPQQSIAKTVVKDLQAEVVQKQATLAKAKADAAYQKAQLARHQLVAPFAGVISRRVNSPGEWVTPGSGVFELVDTTDLRIDFAVSEDYLAHVQPGARVLFTLNAFPEKPFEALIDTIVPVTNPGARTFLLKTHLQHTDPRILPGMSVKATLEMATDRHNLVVPRDAILHYPDGRSVVWSVEQDGDNQVAREHRVETGESFAGLIEIRSDLTESTPVVVRGNESLRDGQHVFILTTGSEP